VVSEQRSHGYINRRFDQQKLKWWLKSKNKLPVTSIYQYKMVYFIVVHPFISVTTIKLYGSSVGRSTKNDQLCQQQIIIDQPSG